MMAEPESKPRSDGLPSVPSSVKVLHPTTAHLAQGAYKRWVQGVEQAVGGLKTKRNLRGGREVLSPAWKMFKGAHGSSQSQGQVEAGSRCGLGLPLGVPLPKVNLGGRLVRRKIKSERLLLSTQFPLFL